MMRFISDFFFFVQAFSVASYDYFGQIHDAGRIFRDGRNNFARSAGPPSTSRWSISINPQTKINNFQLHENAFGFLKIST